ncbi:hypothetical protein [Occallatibacter riparius]|uniref:Uncharacterized protein n=1 Tax=Occallatibacter riparius TaxID=1002689 RepID=A0A9J7BXF2_9BACT|nr:hypothetical protein [Occallatibacter riparius]UWZ85662.1 hypothetical protein MOP44_06885 [Occallatibacter riparius]
MATSVASAKQFLVDRIAAEAEREGAPLNEIEKAMLAFSEVGASEKELDQARTFERDFDDKEYESRIARLARSVYDRDVAAGRKAEWDQALDELASEDFYLMVMLEQAGIVKTTSHLRLPDWRLLVGFVPALVCVALAAAVAFTPLGSRIFPNDVLRLAVAVLLLLAPFALGRLRGRRAG